MVVADRLDTEEVHVESNSGYSRDESFIFTQHALVSRIFMPELLCGR